VPFLMSLSFGRRAARWSVLGVLTTAWLLTLVVGRSSAADPSGGCATAAGVTACTFSFTGAQESWVAPSGVTSVTVDAYGAAGKQLTGAQTAGLGAHVQATLAVTPGATYYVTVGGAGAYGSTGGGFNGGGNGGTFPFPNDSFVNGSFGGGGGDPRAPNTTAKGRARNRYVSIQVRY
jgi:hypothetical protein